jgi:hypothetical protein
VHPLKSQRVAHEPPKSKCVPDLVLQVWKRRNAIDSQRVRSVQN